MTFCHSVCLTNMTYCHIMAASNIFWKEGEQMKRLFSILVVLMLVFSTAALAEGIDFASMDDAALQALIDGARNELEKRGKTNGEQTVEENTVLFEENGVTVYLTGEHEVWGSDSYYLDLGVVLVNNSDKTVSVLIDTAYVNGWEVYGGGITDTGAGKKQQAVLDFCISDANISTYEEVEEIEMNFIIIDSDTYDTIAELEPVVIHCNAQ